jgi:hypothetical protein
VCVCDGQLKVYLFCAVSRREVVWCGCGGRMYGMVYNGGGSKRWIHPESNLPRLSELPGALHETLPTIDSVLLLLFHLSRAQPIGVKSPWQLENASSVQREDLSWGDLPPPKFRSAAPQWIARNSAAWSKSPSIVSLPFQQTPVINEHNCWGFRGRDS